MQPVRGRYSIGLDIEFLECIRERKRQIHAGMPVVVVSAIEQVVIAALLPSRNRDCCDGGVIERSYETSRSARRPARASGEQNQVRGWAATQGEINNAGLIHQFGNGSVLRRRIREHLDLLGC